MEPICTAPYVVLWDGGRAGGLAWMILNEGLAFGSASQHSCMMDLWWEGKRKEKSERETT